MFRDSIAQILGLPPNSNPEVLIHEVGQYYMESWIDGLKIKYVQKKLHDKQRGLLYEAMIEEIKLDQKGGIMEDVTNLCNKYSLPNVIFHWIEEEKVNMAVQDMSRRRVFLTVGMLKSVPMIPHAQKRRLMPDHWTFGPMESRAITAFNTGHLVFRGTKPFKFKGRYAGSKTCLYDLCNSKDTLYRVMWHCEWYRRDGIIPKDKVRETGRNVSKDLAEYLIKLHEFRMKKWNQPLIIIEGWL